MIIIYCNYNVDALCTTDNRAHQFVYLHDFLVLFMDPFVFDVQHYFKAFKLLLQIKSLGVLFKQENKQERSGIYTGFPELDH